MSEITGEGAVTFNKEILADPERRDAAVDACLRMKYGANYAWHLKVWKDRTNEGRTDLAMDNQAALMVAASSLGKVNERIDRRSLEDSQYGKDVEDIQRSLDKFAGGIRRQRPSSTPEESLVSAAEELTAAIKWSQSQSK